MKYKKKPHLFETNLECLRRYNELLKESRYWNSMGQYWLGKECESLSQQLLNGDESVMNTIIKTETYIFKP